MTETGTSLRAAGERWVLSGALTMDSVAKVLAASKPLPLPAAGLIDLEHIDRVDSAGVSVMLAWKRRAATEGKSIQFAHVPGNMTALAELYGVEDLLRS